MTQQISGLLSSIIGVSSTLYMDYIMFDEGEKHMQQLQHKFNQQLLVIENKEQII